MTLSTGTRREWLVEFLGDGDYGRDEWGDYPHNRELVEANCASDAARKALAEWRRRDSNGVRDDGWYGDGTIIGVQEVVPAPPVLTFVREGGRLKKEKG